jgi:hypothetical protein
MNEVTTADEALRIAEDECVRRGFVWRDPTVKRGWRYWRVSTPGGQRGGNSVIYVARRDGTTKVRHFTR